MEKKFKCQSCGQSFMADTSKYVTCPNCGSDNVSLNASGSNIMKFVVIGAGVAVLICLVVIGVKYFSNTTSPGTEFVVEEPAQTTDIADKTIIPEAEASAATVSEIEKELPRELTFVATGNPEYDAKSESYSLTVQAKMMGGNSDNAKIEYVVCTQSGEEIKTNETGVFTGIPSVSGKDNPEGTYIVVARAIVNGETVSQIDKAISGFKPVPKAVSVPKLSVAQVQALINNHAGAQELNANPSISGTCKVRSQGDMKDVTVKNFSELIERVSMEILKEAKVTSLEYDDSGHVICVIFTPVFPD